MNVAVLPGGGWGEQGCPKRTAVTPDIRVYSFTPVCGLEHRSRLVKFNERRLFLV